MPKDKYARTFSRQMEAIVFIIVQIFFAARAVFKLGNITLICPSFSWAILSYVPRLDKLYERNI